MGAGRDKKSDKIDFGAGCVLNFKIGDKVSKDDILLTLYYSDNVSKERLSEAIDHVNNAYKFSIEKIDKQRVV